MRMVIFNLRRWVRCRRLPGQGRQVSLMEMLDLGLGES